MPLKEVELNCPNYMGAELRDYSRIQYMEGEERLTSQGRHLMSRNSTMWSRSISQGTKHTDSNGPRNDVMTGALHPCALWPPRPPSCPSRRKLPDKHRLRDILWNTWLVLLKNAKINKNMESKERSQTTEGEGYRKTECSVGSWNSSMGSWKGNGMSGEK